MAQSTETDPKADPRVVVDAYVVRPTGYDDLVHTDKDAWCLHVKDGHAWGWSVRRGNDSWYAMNRKGEFVMESRGSGRNKPRRWPLDEALALALKYVDTHKINGRTAREASSDVALRIALREAAEVSR